MTHIKSFGIGNFRAFSSLEQFEFKPITILTGTNSSGKSSLTKAMLLLKNEFNLSENIDKRFTSEITKLGSLNLIRSNLNLGGLDKISNKLNNDKSLYFELPFRLPNIIELYTVALTYGKIKDSDPDSIISLRKLEVFPAEIRNTPVIYFEQEDNERANFSIDIEHFLSHLRHYYSQANQYISAVNKKLERNSLEDVMIDTELMRLFPIMNLKELLYFDRQNNILNPLIYFLGDIDFSIFPISNEEFDPHLPIFGYSIFDEINTNKLNDFLSDNNIKDKKSLVEILCKVEIDILLEFYGGTGTEDKKFDNFDKVCKTLIQNYFLFNPGGIINDEGLYEEFTDLEWLLFIIENNQIADFEIWKRASDFGFISKTKNSIFFSKKFLSSGIEKALLNISNAFKNIEFLPSVRATTQRLYLGNDVSEFTELLFEFYRCSSNLSKIHWDFLKRSLQLYDLADDILVQSDQEGVGISIYLKNGNELVNLADVGYGYSQLIPIILKIVLVASDKQRKNPVLIIEEPETNLHPAYQSKLADLFIDSFKAFGIQFIIETHSEYFVRKMQFLTARKEIGPDFTQLYYFYHPDKIPEGEKQVKRIDMNEDGSLSADFGTGFFDESDKIAISLFSMQQSQKN